MSRVILLLLYTLNWCTYCHCLHSMWGRVYKTVERPSVRLFVPSFHSRSSLQRVCYRVPRGQEISIVTRHWHSAATAPQHGAQQQMRAVSCWQPRDEAEHRFVRYIVHFYNDMLLTAVKCQTCMTNRHIVSRDLFVTFLQWRSFCDCRRDVALQFLARIRENWHTPPSFLAPLFRNGWKDLNTDGCVALALTPDRTLADFVPVILEFVVIHVLLNNQNYAIGHSRAWPI